MGFFSYRKTTSEDQDFRRKLAEQKRENRRRKREEHNLQRIAKKRNKLLKQNLKNESMKQELVVMAGKKEQRKLVKKYREEKYAPVYKATAVAKKAYANLQKRKPLTTATPGISTRRAGKRVKKLSQVQAYPTKKEYNPFSIEQKPVYTETKSSPFTTEKKEVYTKRKDYDAFGMNDKV